MTKPKLKIVETKTHRPVAVDIYENWKADIAKRDWDAVMKAGDRREPVDLPETRKGWRR